MLSDEQLQPLRQVINAAYSISEEAWRAFAAPWQSVEVRRKVLLTAEGSTERYSYFVLEGIQRVYYLHSSGREATLVFTYPPSFSGVVDSFLLQQPSRYFLETLTPSRLLRLHYDQLATLMDDYPEIERLMRLLVSRALAGTLERQVELQSYTAEEKFSALLRRSPHVLTLIPHKYLANYLGIDPTNFSKFLGRVRIG